MAFHDFSSHRDAIFLCYREFPAKEVFYNIKNYCVETVREGEKGKRIYKKLLDTS